MNPLVEYVGFRGNLLVKERWQATTLFCPRCGQGRGHVWERLLDIGQEEAKVDGLLPVRLFLCIGCGHVGYGWGGFKPNWSVQERAQQIIQLGFGQSE